MNAPVVAPKPAPVPEWVRRAQAKQLVAKDMGR